MSITDPKIRGNRPSVKGSSAEAVRARGGTVPRDLFAKRLVLACDRSGFQLKWIAGQVGIDARTFSRWRSGANLPKSKRLWERLADVLDVTVEWLQGIEEEGGPGQRQSEPEPDSDPRFVQVDALLQRIGSLVTEARSACASDNGQDTRRLRPLAGHATYQRPRRRGDGTR